MPKSQNLNQKESESNNSSQSTEQENQSLNNKESADKFYNIPEITLNPVEEGKEWNNTKNLEKSHKKSKSTSDLPSLLKNNAKALKVATIENFVPLFNIVTTVTDEIVQIYEGAQYNKKTLNSLMDRVEVASSVVNTIKRRKDENEANFRNPEYYKSFLRFVKVMERIKKLMTNLSSLQRYKRFLNTNSIKDKFEAVTKDFDEVMTDLQFTTTVSNEEQRRRDQEALKDDIAELKEYTKQIKNSLDSLTSNINSRPLQENTKNQIISEKSNFTNLPNQLNQLEAQLTKIEQKILNLEILIKYKESEIEVKETELKNSSLNEKEKNKLESQITDLKNQILNLQNQLTEKGKKVVDLAQKNNELMEQCLYCLMLVNSFQAKHKELAELKENLTKKNPSKEAVDKLCQLQKELMPLESELEEIIAKQQLTIDDSSKKRYWSSKQVQVDEPIIDKCDKVIAELGGRKSQIRSIAEHFKEEMQRIINSCDKNTIKSAFLISRTEKDKSLFNIHNLSTPKDKEIIEKTIKFLNAKQIFITTRQGTIKRLQECCDKLEYYINCGWYAKINATSQGISGVGEAVNSLDFGITQGIGTVISSGNELFKINRYNKHVKKFNQHLNSDKNKRFWFNNHYSSLFKSICDSYESKISPIIVEVLKLSKGNFANEYDVFKIAKKDMAVWENKSYLSSEEMKSWIKVLDENLDNFEKELKSEEEEFYQRIVELEKELASQEAQIQIPPK